MISVILPSRGRVKEFWRSVASICNQAAHPENIEIVVRTDDDDAALTPFLHSWVHTSIRELRGPRLGYGRIHDYYNELAAEVKGEHLLIWNDDTEMLTPNWDELLLADTEAAKCVQFIRRDICEKADDTFPLVPRDVYEAMGHLSLHCYLDTWLSCVSNLCGIIRFRNDVVFHHHRLADQTAADQQAAIAVEHTRFKKMGPQQSEDIRKVQAMLAKRSR